MPRPRDRAVPDLHRPRPDRQREIERQRVFADPREVALGGIGVVDRARPRLGAELAHVVEHQHPAVDRRHPGALAVLRRPTSAQIWPASSATAAWRSTFSRTNTTGTSSTPAGGRVPGGTTSGPSGVARWSASLHPTSNTRT